MKGIKVMDGTGIVRDKVNVCGRRSAGILVFEFLWVIVWWCWSWRVGGVAALLLIARPEDLVDFSAHCFKSF